MPQMGSVSCGIDVLVDIHDNTNCLFHPQEIFELANVVTREKIKDIKIEYWEDEDGKDVICSYAFKGWISHWHTSGGDATSHLLSMSFNPRLIVRISLI